MKTAFDLSRPHDGTLYGFGIKSGASETLAAHLRALADEIEAHTTQVSEVETLQRVSHDDFETEVLSIRYCRRKE